jgi:hypothetical protein
MFKRTVIMAATAMLMASPGAWAQDATPSPSTSGGQRLMTNLSVGLGSSLHEEAQAGGARGTRRTFIPRVFAGLWTAAGDGFLVGAGVSTRPFTEEKHEIQGNAAYNRIEGLNGFGIDVDYLYNFAAPSGQSFTPFAAAGLNVTRFSFDCGDLDDLFGIDCSSTDAALQIGGGLKFPRPNGREFFVELYFILNDSSPVVIRGGLGF